MNVRHPRVPPRGSVPRGSVDDDREIDKLYWTAHVRVTLDAFARVCVRHIFPMWFEHIPLVMFGGDMSRSFSCAKF